MGPEKQSGYSFHIHGMSGAGLQLVCEHSCTCRACRKTAFYDSSAICSVATVPNQELTKRTPAGS